MILEKQRAEENKIHREIQRKKDLISQGEVFLLQVSESQTGGESADLLSALKKMEMASECIDMTHSSSPSLKGFTGEIIVAVVIGVVVVFVVVVVIFIITITILAVIIIIIITIV